MKQNRYRTNRTRPANAGVEVLTRKGVKYAMFTRNATAGFKTGFSGIALNVIFGIMACLFLLAMAGLCYGIMFLFSI